MNHQHPPDAEPPEAPERMDFAAIQRGFAMESPCSLCSKIVIQSHPNYAPSISHEPCPCDDTATAASEGRLLCTFCQHLRLRHILFCEQRTFEIDLREHFANIRDRHADTNCVFCGFIIALLDQLPPLNEAGVFPGQLRLIRDCDNFGGSRGDTIFHFSESFYTAAGEETAELTVRMTAIDQGTTLPNISQRVRWDVVRNWVNSCFHEHPECTPRPISKVPEGFRLVDVKRRKLIRAQSPPHFVALSYVWGSTQDPSKTTARTSNIRNLEKPGSLCPTVLPNTIEDAIAICKSIGEDFLWVDSLCIAQDDTDNKQHQIDFMASIYSSAKLVLVIASGRGMGDNIPGVSYDREVPLHLNFCGLQFTHAYQDPWRTLSNSTWSTRGWTYQEAILAKRRLYVMENEVWFECERVMEVENCLGHRRIRDEGPEETYRYWGWIGTLLRDPYDIFDSYVHHLREYTGRKLTHEDDRLNAFSGIFRGLYDSRGGSLFGMPFEDFDRAILWTAIAANCPGPQALNANTSPSWSWSSSQVTVAHLQSKRFVGTLTKWFYYVKGENAFNLIQSTGVPNHWSTPWSSDFPNSSSKLCLELSLSHGCFEFCSSSLSDWKTQSFEKLGKISELRWPQYLDYLNEALPTSILSSKILPSISNPEIGYQGTVYCRAQSAFFRTSLKHVGAIVDANEEQVGLLEISAPGNDMCRPKSDQSTGLELIAISISYRPFYWPNIFHGDFDSPPTDPRRISYNDYPQEFMDGEAFTAWKNRGFTVFDCEGQALLSRPIVNVMMIGRDDEGYAYRLGVGWILLTKWAEADRNFVNVALR